MELDQMTVKQLRRLHRQAWARMTRNDGYQPFGYDAITLRITRPVWFETVQAIARAHDAKLTS